MTIQEQVDEAFVEMTKNLREDLTEALENLVYVRDFFIQRGHCFTLPDGSCMGNRCEHDPRTHE